ncbi:phage tail protein I [Salinicola sp. LHM]|uniref:phage tail protein I n=1 Tax=Salinicola sp. LHM TaxID=3065298 RepID=UPI002ACE8A46|nr:phage tail protein I [Salinicola sp. LHM]WQH33368.1 phage tail protein I [Salinicola sp. LHM]
MSTPMLPPNATPLERRVASVNGAISDLPTPLRTLWNPATIRADLLPYLAWALSIGIEWEFARTEAERRALVASAVDLHRYKGTPYAIRRGLQLLGFRDAEIIEGMAVIQHDSEIVRDGSQAFAGSARWALFRIVADLGNQEGLDAAQVARVRRIVETYKNARSHLHALSFRVNVTTAVEHPTTISLPLHVGWQPARAKGVRDGRLARGSTRRYRRDGKIRFDGALDRAARVVSATTHYRAGEIYLRSPISVRLRTPLARDALLPRDGRLAFDGSARRGTAMATVTPPTLRVARTLLRDGRSARGGFGPARDGAHTYADGRLRGARYRHATHTTTEAFA